MLAQIKKIIPNSIKEAIKRILGRNNSQDIQIYESYAGKKILEGQDSNELIFKLLSTNQPAMIARIGSVEQSCLNNYFQLQNKKTKQWQNTVANNMWGAAGFFPNTPEMLEKFSVEMIEHLKNLDILGVWFNEGEKYTCENLCPQANFVNLPDLEPYYHENPWSRVLKGKKVLVIHPFAQSIQEQFSKRSLLFKNADVLPECDLQVIQAVQSIAGNKPPYESWFQALDYMTEKASQKDFDIAIIGAGAYGLPLASNIKKMGKQAMHLGGATQILFGIKGKRWEEREFFQNLFNEHWIKPNENEKPKNADNVEGGCYW